MAALKEDPLREHQEGDMDDNEETFSAGGCGCLRLLGIGWRQSSGKESKHLLQDKREHRETWLNKIKQVTEVFGGPKWKTFIRKMGGYKKQRNGFQYDPRSYALNFDNGFDREEEEGLVSHDFTSRFPAPFHDEKRPTGL
jgi:hypothetical protein